MFRHRMVSPAWKFLNVLVKFIAWTESIPGLSMSQHVIIFIDFAKGYSVTDQGVHRLQSYFIGKNICKNYYRCVYLDLRTWFYPNKSMISTFCYFYYWLDLPNFHIHIHDTRHYSHTLALKIYLINMDLDITIASVVQSRNSVQR